MPWFCLGLRCCGGGRTALPSVAARLAWRVPSRRLSPPLGTARGRLAPGWWPRATPGEWHRGARRCSGAVASRRRHRDARWCSGGASGWPQAHSCWRVVFGRRHRDARRCSRGVVGRRRRRDVRGCSGGARGLRQAHSCRRRRWDARLLRGFWRCVCDPEVVAVHLAQLSVAVSHQVRGSPQSASYCVRAHPAGREPGTVVPDS